MKKIRVFLLALLMLATSVFVTATNVTPVSAWTASCVFSPGPTTTHYGYGGAFCSTNRIGGAFHQVAVNCKYILIGIAHTYWVNGPWTPDNQWSWAYCGHHAQDGPNNNDWVIHIHANFDPNDGGGGSSGSW